MNDNGKVSISYYTQCLILLFCLLLIMPYYEANGGLFPFNNLTNLQLAEIVSWCMFIAFIFLSLYTISFLISSVCCYAVYFVQRAWYLHKLRKPERVYTGDPL